jgi:hypothetical protein
MDNDRTDWKITHFLDPTLECIAFLRLAISTRYRFVGRTASVVRGPKPKRELWKAP